MRIRNLLSLIGTTALLMVSGLAAAQVQDSSGTATINVQPMLAITLNASPNWGKVAAPTSGSAVYSLACATGVVSIVGSPANAYVFASSGAAAGDYTISGGPGAPIAFTVTCGVFTPAGNGAAVTVTQIFANSTSTNTGTGVLDSTTGLFDLEVGGTLSVPSNADVTGPQTATVTVTVNYN